MTRRDFTLPLAQLAITALVAIGSAAATYASITGDIRALTEQGLARQRQIDQLTRDLTELRTECRDALFELPRRTAEEVDRLMRTPR